MTNISDIIRAEQNLFLEGEKVAFIKPDGKFQMLPGKAELRGRIEAWMETNPDSNVGPSTPPAELTKPKPKAKVIDNLEVIPPCPEMDPRMGDKTPAVIEWWHTYHPEAAAEKYKNRRYSLEAPEETPDLQP